MTNNTVPKSITRIREEWNGLPIWYVVVVIGFLILSSVLASSILLLHRGQWIFITMLFLELAFFFKFLRTPKIMDKSILMSKFIFKSIKGETIVAKFKLPDGFIESIIPVKAFHPDGIIEFIGDKYGLLMRIAPSRISEDDIETHIQKTKALIDSLHGETMVKTFVCSIRETNYKPLAKNVVNIMNTQDRTIEQKKHLESIFDDAQENDTAVIQWQFYVFLFLGVHPNIEKATIAKKQYYPGFEHKLQKLGVLVAPLKEKEVLAAAYRKCITQEGYS